MAQGPRGRSAAWLLVGASALGLIMALIDYFLPDNGISGSLGVLVVIGSTALMLIASAAIALGFARGFIRGLLAFLILIDILGTGFAGYMLDDYILLGFMCLGLLAWLIYVFAGGQRRQVEAVGVAS